MDSNVKKITFGAMMVAMVGVMLVINRQFANFFELYFLFIMPIPLIVFRVKYDLKFSIITAFSMIILSLLISFPTTVFYVISASVIGLVYGSLLKKDYSNLTLIITSILFSIIVNVFVAIIFSAFFGLDFRETIRQTHEIIKYTMQLSGVDIAVDLNILSVVISTLIILLTGVIEGLLIHVSANLVLRKLKVKIRPIKPIIEWELNKYLAYAFMFFYVLFGLVNVIDLPDVYQYVIIVLGLISSGVLMMFGYIGIVVFGLILYKKNISIIIILLTVFLSIIMLPLLVIFGFVYCVTDLKKDLIRRELNDKKI